MSRAAVLRRAAVSVLVFAALIAVAVGVFTGRSGNRGEGVVQCSAGGNPTAVGCPEWGPSSAR